MTLLPRVISLKMRHVWATSRCVSPRPAVYRCLRVKHSGVHKPLFWHIRLRSFMSSSSNSYNQGSGTARDGSPSASINSGTESTSLRSLQKRAIQLITKENVKKTIEKYYGSGPHLAGTNQSLVDYTREAFDGSGFSTSVSEYSVWLNYPKSHRVEILNSDGTAAHKLKLEEPPIDEVPNSKLKDRVPTFHGYSPSGKAKGQLVYANFGRREDFNELKEKGVDVKGKIVLIRNGHIFRGLKVKFAEEAGASAVLIYSDPAEDGEINEEEFNVYPEGPARHPDSVERGSVLDIALRPGDPTTPGWASLPGNETKRVDPQGLPKIPSIPISINDAKPLLKALSGQGPKFEDWEGSFEDYTYSAGPSEVDVSLESEQDYGFRSIFNIIARLQGESDEEIIIGNHRDAWTAGNADANSGSGIIVEAARALGALAKDGWKPKRTIVFASWDGGEYGLLGSTEWAEENAQHLSENAIAYINCDGVTGGLFAPRSNPLFHEIIRATSDITPVRDTDLREHWSTSDGRYIRPLGSGSDYVVFQDHLAIPSMDLRFKGADGWAVNHLHSNYDSVHWLEEMVDWDLQYCESLSRYIALITLALSEKKVIPYNVVDWAKSLKDNASNLLSKYQGSVDVKPLYTELDGLAKAAAVFHDKTKDAPEGQLFSLNRTLLKAERKLIYEEGLDERTWYKHIAIAPSRNSGYDPQFFPGIAESLADKDEKRLQKWVDVTSRVIKNAASHLN